MIRRLSFILPLVLLIAWAEAMGGEVRFRWNANPEPDIAGYRLSYGTDAGSLNQSVNTGKVTRYTLGGLEQGQTYFFALRAVNTAGLVSDPTPVISATISNLAPPLDMSGTEIHSVSSEEAPKHEAGNILDGNATTFWHTRWSEPGSLAPHYIAVKLPRRALASVLYYTPRQDRHTNGIVEHFEVETSLDGIQWTEVASGTWAKDHSQKHALLEYGEARYVRLWGSDNAATCTSLAIGGQWVPEPPALVNLTLQASEDLREWRDLHEMSVPRKDREFYRIEIER